jgi:hypothetical protein
MHARLVCVYTVLGAAVACQVFLHVALHGCAWCAACGRCLMCVAMVLCLNTCAYGTWS